MCSLQTCREKMAVLDVNNNQIINLTTNYGLSGCTINAAGIYQCNGGRIFRSSRERWWFIAVSHCDRDPTDVRGDMSYLSCHNSASGLDFN